MTFRNKQGLGKHTTAKHPRIPSATCSVSPVQLKAPAASSSHDDECHIVPPVPVSFGTVPTAKKIDPSETAAVKISKNAQRRNVQAQGAKAHRRKERDHYTFAFASKVLRWMERKPASRSVEDTIVHFNLKGRSTLQRWISQKETIHAKGSLASNMFKVRVTKMDAKLFRFEEKFKKAVEKRENEGKRNSIPLLRAMLSKKKWQKAMKDQSTFYMFFTLFFEFFLFS